VMEGAVDPLIEALTAHHQAALLESQREDNA